MRFYVQNEKKRQSYHNTHTDVLRSDTVTVTDIRYFTATADSTEESFWLYMRKSEPFKPNVM